MDGNGMLDGFLKVLSGIAIAAASSWITVYLSRHRFRSEKWWERKVLAYERVIEAFHNAKKFASEHMDAEDKGRKVEEERDKELRHLAKLGREEILRSSDVGSFILSAQALGILARYEAETEAISKCETWIEYLDADWTITNKYMKELVAEAHADLKR